jgi:hypothetical protein
MSHDPIRHEILTGTTRSAGEPRAAIERIFEGTVAQALPGGVWPVHPLEVLPAVNRGVYISPCMRSNKASALGPFMAGAGARCGTGDVGLAIFLASCISGTAQFPTSDIA